MSEKTIFHTNNTQITKVHSIKYFLLLTAFPGTSEHGTQWIQRGANQRTGGGDHRGTISQRSLPFYEEERNTNRKDPTSGLQTK